jgi:hypothetical protein
MNSALPTDSEIQLYACSLTPYVCGVILFCFRKSTSLSKHMLKRKNGFSKRGANETLSDNNSEFYNSDFFRNLISGHENILRSSEPFSE